MTLGQMWDYLKQMQLLRDWYFEFVSDTGKEMLAGSIAKLPPDRDSLFYVPLSNLHGSLDFFIKARESWQAGLGVLVSQNMASPGTAISIADVTVRHQLGEAFMMVNQGLRMALLTLENLEHQSADAARVLLDKIKAAFGGAGFSSSDSPQPDENDTDDGE